MKNNTFLPIGSVVLLNGGTKKVMITGFLTTSKDDKTSVYDYSGCMYPEGIIDSSEICLFNNNQIKEVSFKGFENEDELKFKKDLLNTSKVIEPNDEVVQTFSINDSIFN